MLNLFRDSNVQKWLGKRRQFLKKFNFVLELDATLQYWTDYLLILNSYCDSCVLE